jgi:tRNA threonylcarbamoyladenosine biosynthesis protein TsaE
MITLNSETETLALGEKFAKHCPDSLIIFLKGELGSGKTTFARGFLRGFNYQGSVKSPTYTLVEPYELDGKRIFHFDLYRLNYPEELDNIGIRDYFIPPRICLIEWPERAEKILPLPDVTCSICSLGSTKRTMEINAHTEIGLAFVNSII